MNIVHANNIHRCVRHYVLYDIHETGEEQEWIPSCFMVLSDYISFEPKISLIQYDAQLRRIEKWRAVFKAVTLNLNNIKIIL